MRQQNDIRDDWTVTVTYETTMFETMEQGYDGGEDGGHNGKIMGKGEQRTDETKQNDVHDEKRRDNIQDGWTR
jgi:hypothetical protein